MGQENFGVQGGLDEEDYWGENVGEDDNDDDDEDYECDRHHVSPEDGDGDDIKECDVEMEEDIDQGFFGDEALLVGTSSAQSGMCFPVMPIVVTDQLFGKNDINIELEKIYLSKEAFAYSLSLFSMRQNFETLVHKSTKSLLVVKCKPGTCGWRKWACKLRLYIL